MLVDAPDTLENPAATDAVSLARPLVQRCETCVLTAYPDPGSPRAAALRLAPADRPPLWWRNPGDPWTIGWGHTGGVIEGMVWTQEKADQQLELDLAEAASWAFKLVHPPYAIHVFAALTAFIVNVGEKAFAGSTMHFLLGNSQTDAAAAEFARWDHSHGKVVEGLLKRRLAEQALFLGKDWKQQIEDFEASIAS